MSFLSLYKKKNAIQKGVSILFLCVFLSGQSVYAKGGKPPEAEGWREMLDNISAFGGNTGIFFSKMPAFVSTVDGTGKAIKRLAEKLNSSFIDEADRDGLVLSELNLQLTVYSFISDAFKYLEEEKNFDYRNYIFTLFSLKTYLYNKDEIAEVELELLIGLQVFLAEKLAWIIKDKRVNVTNRVTDETLYRNKLLNTKRQELQKVKSSKSAIETVGKERLSVDNVDDPKTQDHLILSSYFKRLYSDLLLRESQLMSDVQKLQGSQYVLAPQMQGRLSLSGGAEATGERGATPDIFIEDSDEPLAQRSSLDDLCAFLNGEVTDDSGDIDGKTKKWELAVWLMSLSSECLEKYSRFSQEELMKKYVKSHASDFAAYVFSLHFQTVLELSGQFDPKIYGWLKALRKIDTSPSKE